LLIDDSVMDKLIPLKDKEELKAELIDELKEEGFKVTNFNVGGVFYHLLMIVITIYLELVNLARTILNNMFVSHAEGDWLELKAADYCKTRKDASKTKGYITITRDVATEPLFINKGNIFKTLADANGTELKYYLLEAYTMETGVFTVKLLVEAENEGTAYNVSENRSTKSLLHLENVTAITNESNWLYKEGADQESIESLRNRTLNIWSELSDNPIAAKYKNVAEGMVGVLNAKINDQHPRGQGTVDIIITGTAGAATQELINNVTAAITTIKGNYDNVKVISSEVASQDFEIIIYLAEGASDSGVDEQAKTIIVKMMRLSDRSELNLLYRDDIIYNLKNAIVNYKKSDIIQPATDIILETNKVLILGNVNITVKRVS
jgi:uncharacterized phage protein gp47/JayE